MAVSSGLGVWLGQVCTAPLLSRHRSSTLEIQENMLHIYDPKALHHILVKDLDIFEITPPVVAGSRLFFGPGLLSSHGEYHKRQRKLLNPVFSTTHMRQILPTVYAIMHRLEAAIVNQVQGGPKEIDMLSWMGRTALELIGQSGFGHSFDDLTDNLKYAEESFSRAVKRITPLTLEMVFLRVYALHHLIKIGSGSFRKKVISALPWKSMHEGRDIADAMYKTSYEIYHKRKQAILDGTAVQDVHEKDLLSILIKANMDTSKPEEERPSEEENYAQLATFIFAGTETTSNATACILWLLAQNQDVQTKLRIELREAMEKADGDIPHDELVGLPYLDAICRETLRLYAPVWQLSRKPTKDIFLPLSHPITGLDGRKISEIFVPKGTNIMCGLLASNRNTDIWGPDADEWKPERWLEGLPDSVSDAHLPGIYSHLMTFSAGGRSCIGLKFSQLEMKAILAVLLSRFEFSLSQEITWCMTNIASPIAVGGDYMNPRLQLMVKLAA
ncbi:hypothetical protein CVT24_004346 [Panaeolus cyanescens]|uniref:Cytochrome P450 n=1 Tax=Panaeolus cyanescens TaxID=181874 RepID=A0A409W7R3_9AGAR|nr:hypothetical protein CVT24_004346 [Panaeolus cyanescens]